MDPVDVSWAFPVRDGAPSSGDEVLSLGGGAFSSGQRAVRHRSDEVSGLERGKDIWVRLRARNTNGPGPWNDPATIMAT